MYDVTSMIQEGPNAIGVMLGNGWYGQGVQGPKSLLFQLQVNGSPFLASSTDWKGIQGPIIMDSIWNGETYDARLSVWSVSILLLCRLETPGWTSPNFNDAGWSQAQTIEAPGTTILVMS
jgi:alpha-L-rhamnosidase